MNIPAFLLAIILICSIIALVFLLALFGKTDTDTFKILVGALMSVGFTNVIGFYFGSTVSSKNKDDTITNLATGAGAGVAAEAARAAAPAAAARAAPPAAEKAAPPVVKTVVPPVVEAAVTKAFAKQAKKKGRSK